MKKKNNNNKIVHTNISDNNRKTIENNPMTLITNVCSNDIQHVKKKERKETCYHYFIIGIIIHHRSQIASLPVIYRSVVIDI